MMSANQFILIVLLFLLIDSCQIEKRKYLKGYHVTFSGQSNPSSQLSKQSEKKKTIEPKKESNAIALEKKVNLEANVFCAEPIISEEKKTTPSSIKRGKHAVKKRELPVERVSQNDTNFPQKIQAELHPAASGSFLMGLLSACCFVLLFVISFNPVWLVIALAVSIIVFALLAKKLSKRAFDDMYYARNRFSGKALAAAGLALGIISLVALIGLIAIVIFGVAFISFS